MKVKLFSIVLGTCVIFCVGSAKSQVHYLKVSGVVLDSLTISPIESAYIYIRDTPVGVASSSLGQFELNIPDALIDSTITISCLGYKTQFYPVNVLKVLQSPILLAESVSILGDFVVTEHSDSGRIVLKKAIANIEKNYPRKKHLLEGFYRELSIKDTTYTRLIEASILIQEPSYSRVSFDKRNLDIQKSRVQIQEMRKSEDFRTYDMMGKAMKLLLGSRNDMYEILEDNYIRFLGTKSEHFLSDKFLTDYKIYISGRTELDGEPVYVVKLKSTQDLFFIREVIFYIDVNDYAFLKIEYSMLINGSNEKLKKSSIVGKYLYHSEVYYRKIEHAYVPFLIRTQKYANNTNPLVKSDGGTALQYTDLTFSLTDFSDKDFSKIKRKEMESKSTDINEIEWIYNKTFWENYNVIKLHPVNAKAKTDLERKAALESQFQKDR